MESPYANLPKRAFWRSGVAARADSDPGDLYHPRFPITREMKITTAGSCFAQHVGRTLRNAGFNVQDMEELPIRMPDSTAQKFGFRMYSARYGNIYTARQLAQLAQEADGSFSPATPVWRKGDRYFDAQRPNVEPDGLESEASVLEHRRRHLQRVSRAFKSADLFVFTFGLTEAWIHTASGTVYPTAPGTLAGAFDPDVYSFKNYDVMEVMADFERFRAMMKAKNPEMKFLVTVSPVPLTATASGAHVEVATVYSKSVLRAACGMLTAKHEDVDYFPSFEIITSQKARGGYYEENMRSVSERGVKTAMGVFMRAHGAEVVDEDAAAGPSARPMQDATLAKAEKRKRRKAARKKSDDVVCEDVLLEAFDK